MLKVLSKPINDYILNDINKKHNSILKNSSINQVLIVENNDDNNKNNKNNNKMNSVQINPNDIKDIDEKEEQAKYNSLINLGYSSSLVRDALIKFPGDDNYKKAQDYCKKNNNNN